jgi:hypothetical protein
VWAFNLAPTEVGSHAAAIDAAFDSNGDTGRSASLHAITLEGEAAVADQAHGVAYGTARSVLVGRLLFS